MAFSKEQCERANQAQRAAAHDRSQQVRLVAGPGSGKSKAIEERVCWLLGEGVPPESVFAISFTRASSNDLRHRIEGACQKNGHPTAKVSVSTLHSLALKILQKANLLTAYPVAPLVLDDWELENVYDNEFGNKHSYGKTRSEQIREYHEAFWSTGRHDHPNYVKPEPPISDAEEDQFLAFHPPRTQTYACVLAGEIVQKCVENIDAGVLDPVELMGIRHLIVDEYQDLNPIDLKFVSLLAQRGITVFVAGDDDQSIYSFRFASPAGIQDFPAEYPGAGVHSLESCFRCTPAVLSAGETLIRANPGPNRIPKRFVSLYETSEPPVRGHFHRWVFQSGAAEAKAIAASCKDLIQAGVEPNSILVLLSNRRALSKPIVDAFKSADVPHEPPKSEGFLDSEVGRFVYSVVRIVCNSEDYIAHRGMLGLLPGVGVKTCNEISESVFANSLNYKDVFYKSLPSDIFNSRATNALARAWQVCKDVDGWDGDNTLGQRKSVLSAILQREFAGDGAAAWTAYSSAFPEGMTLVELREYLGTDNEDQEATVLSNVLERLGEAVPEGGPLPQRVRIMTMHGAKGLSGHVVFIPGLEEQILPGEKKKPYPGLVTEAARMLYVSITRARAACIMSYARTRVVHGNQSRQTHSRFVTQTGGSFSSRTVGLDDSEVGQIAACCGQLNL
ncbi:MAG TPA: ATP-dependent helicase [Isosphaeraceae bacterium]|jgi:DNA helicase-2/ATP-dependent DNA helicase PcrA|nr:ATP-dependent helicase [Isosphaeraceae bacterium]